MRAAGNRADTQYVLIFKASRRAKKSTFVANATSGFEQIAEAPSEAQNDSGPTD
jgi:hypothetical protein